MFKFSLRKQKAAAAIRKWALRLSPDDGYVNYYQVLRSEKSGWASSNSALSLCWIQLKRLVCHSFLARRNGEIALLVVSGSHSASDRPDSWMSMQTGLVSGANLRV